MTSISVGAFQGFAWDCFISGSSFLSTILSSRYSKNAVTSWIPLPKYPPAAGRPDGYFRRHRAAFIAGARPRCPSPVPTARAPVARSPVRVRKGGGRQAGGWRIKKPRSQMSSGRSRISDVRAARSTSLPSSSIVYLLSPSAIHYQHDFISFSFSFSLSLSLSLSSFLHSIIETLFYIHIFKRFSLSVCLHAIRKLTSGVSTGSKNAFNFSRECHDGIGLEYDGNGVDLDGCSPDLGSIWTLLRVLKGNLQGS